MNIPRPPLTRATSFCRLILLIVGSCVLGNHNSVKYVDDAVEGLSSSTSFSSAGPKTVKDDKGRNMQYADCFYLRRFVITDKAKKIVLTRKAFINLPEDYPFRDIVVK